MDQLKHREVALSLIEYLVFVFAFLLAVGGILFLFQKIEGRDETSPVSAVPITKTVILDPGHGGEDGGTVGSLQGVEIPEKDLNLSISLLLRDLLEADGINVVMTRTEDVLLYDRNTDYMGRKKVLDLAARLHVGQSIDDSVFVSIHMNAFPVAKYNGLQVYYSKNNSLSKELANDLQTMTHRYLQPDNQRKIKAATSDIYLLDHLTSPAALIECGFLSNPEDLTALNDPSYQQKLAFILFCTIRSFLSEPEPDEITQNLSNPLIFAPSSCIMNANDLLTEERSDERNENNLHLLILRTEKHEMARSLPVVRRMELLC